MPNYCQAGHSSRARTYPLTYECFPCHLTHAETSDPDGGPLKLPTSDYRPNCMNCTTERDRLEYNIRTAYNNAKRLHDLLNTHTDPQPLIDEAYTALSSARYDRLLNSTKVFKRSQTWNTMFNEIAAAMLNLRYVQSAWHNKTQAETYIIAAQNNISVPYSNFR